jgi:Protein of unknown function (DUF1616)
MTLPRLTPAAARSGVRAAIKGACRRWHDFATSEGGSARPPDHRYPDTAVDAVQAGRGGGGSPPDSSKSPVPSRWSLVRAGLMTLICAVVVVSVPSTVARLPFAALLCLVLPGYAIASAVFPSQRLSTGFRALLTLGLSLSILGTGVLALQFVPGGVRTLSWTCLLVVVTVGALTVAALRLPLTSASHAPLPRLRRPRPAELVLLLVAGLSITAGIALARTPLSMPKVSGYTQLWIMPTEVSLARGVTVGVTSAQPNPVSYRLEVEAPSIGFVRRLTFALSPGQQFTRAVPLGHNSGQPRSASPPLRVDALLYRQDQPSRVYRQVYAWLPTAG